MELCDNGHEEIIYEVRDCPVCELREDLEDEHADHVDAMQTKIEDLEETVSQLEEDLKIIREIED